MIDRSTPGFLVLEDKNRPEGVEFPGFLFGARVSLEELAAGAKGRAGGSPQGSKDRGYGEVIFNTSMTGYQEILTDPSYYGQIICMTNPHIGNTGVNDEDPESERPWCAGFVVHEPCDAPSSWRAQGDLDNYLKKNGIPGLHGVDTRALTRHLRTSGVVRGVILRADDRAKARSLLAELPPFEGRDLILEVTTRKPYAWDPQSDRQAGASAERRKRVVAIDFGIKRNLLRSLSRLGCDVEVVPANVGAQEVLARRPDGVFLSNGPGDPAAATYAHKSVRELVGKVPMFGVCMGHQILALAMGGRTYKLKFGHRGANHPVFERETGKVEISSQNHGYAVDEKSLPPGVEVTHVNLFDKTVAGLRIPGAKAFSVQYHPEACPGPHDSLPLFERFVKSLG